ncbi:hypothetical protein DESUT3_15230 [Desulfuromonas versatilis]|uniref:Uncharacterized protein n=1 Tax=Desulfuromonas versatilis TaxID=2802975 RepID=A0ABM8HNL2_9BACT|nr:hypothetical protein [Desulfuromonas versatilis]BCR04454.1 hypothetical protein DESUT3_15230 [Desulfuromonas versatilis]
MAFTAGKFISEQDIESLYDRDQYRTLGPDELAGRLTKNHPARKGCEVQRDPEAANLCITDQRGDRHICLSLYGRLFEGFDHATASHFTGIVDEGMVTLYDFAESNYFTFDLRN